MICSTVILEIQLHKKLCSYNTPQWQTAGSAISGIPSIESERAKSFGMDKFVRIFARQLNNRTID